MVKNIMIVGVGGQGTLLTSRILGDAAIREGFDVKVSEVHGMSQRGGSVVTYVRFGEKVYSPVIGKGAADILLAFEPLEAARALSNLKPGGVLVTNTQQINPMPVIAGSAEYPAEIPQKIKNLGIDLRAFDALRLAEDAGNSKALNVVLVGYLSTLGIFSEETLLESLKACVPEKLLSVNLKAFELGKNATPLQF
ncbi:MAG: indolepyruvate oxidoreductase subunit beta [Clostridia bacterium]|nr:indolepyruvate oxidoreductase subunit beta [Clostridia bacterium]